MEDLIKEKVDDAAAIRASLQLQPEGGKGDKVFPPTYVGKKDNTAEYAFEERKLEDGRDVSCVLLDSVQSQAKRMKKALLKAVRNDRLDIPIIKAEFDSESNDVVTHLEVSHGIADALFVHCNKDGKHFRNTKYGKILQEASKDNALGLFRICPTALLYGFWDSRPKVGSGKGFQRNITSEIIGIDVKEGLSPAGRISRLGVTGDEGVLDLTENGQIIYVKDEDVKGLKKPSEVGLGNIPPSAYYENGEKKPGGVTMDHAKLISVITLSGLRTISFPKGENGEDEDLNRVCRAVLATLGMIGQELQHELGYPLRSRCSLVPQEDLKFEIVSKTGKVEEIDVGVEETLEAFKNLTESARELGAGWEFEELSLKPIEGIRELIDQSHMRPGV